jgi:hypothetical protein
VRQNLVDNQREVEILASINTNPHVSTRMLAQEVSLSKTTVHRVLKKHNFYPYKVSLVQGLRLTDHEKRLMLFQKCLLCMN